MLSVKKSSLKRILITIIVALFAFSAISVLTTKIIYDSIFARVDSSYTSVPSELEGMVDNREEHSFFSGENSLSGFLYAPDDAKDKNALIILAPGFKASADSYLWQIESLLNYGWAIFSFDTTGSFGSSGKSSIGFSQELCDLEAAIKYVEENGRFGYNDIVLLGHSRGGYAACCALKYNYDISAVVSVSGINSAMEGVMNASADKVGPIAYGNYGFLWLYQAMLFGADTLNTEACEEISQSDVPVLIIHGSEDEQVPTDKCSIFSHKSHISSQNVEYLLCSHPEKNGHTSVLFDNGRANEELMGKINSFLIKNIK